MIRVLFVCHGNICRSAMAKYMFKDMVKKNNIADEFEIDSCGTSDEEEKELESDSRQYHHGADAPSDRSRIFLDTLRSGCDEWSGEDGGSIPAASAGL